MGFLDPQKFEKIVGPAREKAAKEPPLKEEKKDTSAFQGKSYLKRGDVRNWLKRDEMWEIIKKPKEERIGLEPKIFQRKEVGENVDPKEAEKIYNKLKDRPRASKEKYGIKSEGERHKILKTLEKFLGK
jgi:hypothetical protein